MEILTYPFALGMGAVWVFVLLLPWILLTGAGITSWTAWLTDCRATIKFIKINEFLDKFESLVLPVTITGVGGTIITLMISGGFTLRHSSPFLDNLIYVAYTIPVKVAAFVAPVLLPVTIAFFASFAIRKLFRVGFSIQDRLEKVEAKEDKD